VAFLRNGYVLTVLRPALGALAVALLLIGCGPAAESPSRDNSASVSPEDVTTKIVGATPKQETVLREILAGLGAETRIGSVVIRPDGDGVSIDPHVEAGEPVRGEWELWLLANAFSDRSRELDLQQVTALYVNGEGSSTLDSLDPVVPRDPITAEALEEKVHAAARKSDASIDRLQLLDPNNPAVVVRLQVDDPASFIEQRADIFLSTVQTPDVTKYDGLFIELVDADGELAWSYSHAVSEDGEEALWGYIRPELTGCDSRSFGGPMDKPPPPPCPVEGTDPDIEWVPPAEVTTTIIGGTPEQRTIIEETLAGLGPTEIHSVWVRDKVSQAWAGATPESGGIDVKYKGSDSFTDWQAWIVIDVFGRRSVELGLQPVAVAGVNGDRSAGLYFSEDLKERPMTRAEADQALGHVAEIAADHGATTRARVFEPNRLAFAVEFRTAKPAEFLRHGLRRALGPIESGVTEGDQVTVLDARGERVLETGGGVWVRPDLISCSPYFYSPDPSDLPPPCPVE
jgi:hypothetical protein